VRAVETLCGANHGDDSGDAIWKPEEIPHKEAIVDDPRDTRPRPRHEIYYKQMVATEDVFLGTEKTPGCCDCSHLVVKIHFGVHTNFCDLTLEVTKNRLIAESPEK